MDPDLWQDVNLSAAHLYPERVSLEEVWVWHAPGGARPSFAQVLEATAAARDGWTPMNNIVGQKFGPSWTTHWVKIRTKVPREWRQKQEGSSGSSSASPSQRPRRICLLWNSSSEAAVWSMDGRCLQGLTGGNGGDRRTEFILPPPPPASTSSASSSAAEDEEYFECLIEVACNGMFGCDGGGFISPPDPSRTFEVVQAELGLYDGEYADLLQDFTLVKDMARILTSAEAPAGATAARPATARGLQALRVGHAVINVLDVGDRRTWAGASKLLKEFLAPSLGSHAPTIHAVGHCHIDTAWLWPYAETRRKVARSWSAQLDLLDRYPKYSFAASQAVQYQWLKQDYPELFARVKNAVKAGRFLPQGGTWVESDCNIPCGESLVRQMLYGQKFFSEEFELPTAACDVYFLPDTFGYCAQMPQLMRSAGFAYFLTQKLSWGLMSAFPHHSFRWEGLDGSRVLTHFPPADDYNCRVAPEQVLKHASNNRDRGLTNHSLMLFGHGDGGGGPDSNMLERASRMASLDGLESRVEHSTPQRFFRALDADRALKSANRICETLLKEVELWCSVALLLTLTRGAGADADAVTKHPEVYPAEELEHLWKQVLLNQFHDVIPASCIHQVLKDAMELYHQVWTRCSTLLLQAYEAVWNAANNTPASSSSSSSPAAISSSSSSAASPSPAASSTATVAATAPRFQLFDYPRFPLLDDVASMCSHPVFEADLSLNGQVLLVNSCWFGRQEVVSVPAHAAHLLFEDCDATDAPTTRPWTQTIEAGATLVQVQANPISIVALPNRIHSQSHARATHLDNEGAICARINQGNKREFADDCLFCSDSVVCLFVLKPPPHLARSSQAYPRRCLQTAVVASFQTPCAQCACSRTGACPASTTESRSAS